MSSFEKVTKKQSFKLFSIILLLFSLLTTSVPPKMAVADTGGFIDEEGSYGSKRNKDSEIEYERATINKQVSFGENPGEYFIDLTIKGKDATKIEKTDIVLVYDNSNSMNNNNRVGIAKNATTNFVNSLLNAENEAFQLALVTYGSAVFDGRNRNWGSNQGRTGNYSQKTLTENPQEITSKIPSNTPNQRTDGGNGNISAWHGGTFTQQGLEEAGKILDGSHADNKIIITITDGATTFSYANNRQSVEGNGSTYEAKHGSRTIAERTTLVNKGYEVFTIGVQMGSENGISKEEAEQLIRDISSSPDHAYLVEDMPELEKYLNEIAYLLNKSIRNGSIEDPMGEYFILQGAGNFSAATNEELTDGNYYLSGNKEGLTDGVTVTTEGQKILVHGLNLGEDETVTLRYKVQADTDKEGFNPNTLYPTNGPTTLTPKGDNPEEKNTFPEPEASAKPIEVAGEKFWDDEIYKGHRPESVKIHLMRPGYDDPVASATVKPDKDGHWKFEFPNALWYDSNGNFIDYYIEEEPVEHYEMIPAEADENNRYKLEVTNKFLPKPKIGLEKTAKSTSERGEDILEVGEYIHYTFTITNEGNIPLENIILTDELEGISDFEYMTLNGNKFTGTIDDLVLKPGDVLVAIATYEIGQGDFDYGQVNNKATVEGTPFGHDENDPNSPQKVNDEDGAKVPSELEPNITLTKTASPKTVNHVGEEITYTFTIENNGNTTLKDVTLNDPMLGGEIELKENMLLPGDVTTVDVTYKATQKDLNNEGIFNKATAEGTPPTAYTEVSSNPKKVTAEDEENIVVNQNPDIKLEKVANKDNLNVYETITYTFTATNSGNVTLTNVNITDNLAGISEITYESINGKEITNADDITLHSGDVLVGTATYKVTQDDVDFGQLYNKATVKGTPPPKQNPENPESPIEQQPIMAEADVTIGHEPDLGIELIKTSDKQVITESGEEIEFTFEVKNTSSVTLTEVTLNDPMLGGNIELGKTTLSPNETTTGKAKYTVTEEDYKKGTIKNIATATGIPPNPAYPALKVTDEVEVKVAKIELAKSSDPTIYTKKGQEITYTLKVTNTGEVTLNNIVVNDEKLRETIELNTDSLEPGESTEIKIPYTVTEADIEAGEILNEANVIAEPVGYDSEDVNSPKQVTDKDNDKVLYAALELEKTSNKEEVTNLGEEITYIFHVTNKGKVTLNDVTISDPMLEKLGVTVELENSTLAPGESTTGTATYIVTQEDIDNGRVTNVATVTGNPPGYNPTDPDNPNNPPQPKDEGEKIVSIKQDANIQLEKTSDRDNFTEVGQEVTYTFKVKNTGNVTLTDVKVMDETFQFDVGLDKTTLAPGEQATGTFTYTVTQDDMDRGEIHNVAMTEGTPPNYDSENPNETKPTDKDEVKVKGEQGNGILLKKTSNADAVYEIGEEIEFIFTVKNTGNITLNNVQVNDPMLGGKIELEESVLLPGETTKGKAKYTVTEADYEKGYIKNIATATGTPPGYDTENPPTDPEDPTYPPVDEDEKIVKTKHPAIQLIKSSDTPLITEAGQLITYTFKVKNTGNVTLQDVKVDDKTLGIKVNLPKTTLKPGETVEGYAQYVVKPEDLGRTELLNLATVSGTPDGYNPADKHSPQQPTDEDEEVIPTEKGKKQPSIQLEKTSDKKIVSKVGEKVTYTFTVTNKGQVPLTDVKVKDLMLGGTIELGKKTLEPGESTIGKAVYEITEEDLKAKEIVNIATAEGTPPPVENHDDPNNPTLQEPVTDEDKDIVYPKENMPSFKPEIKLLKASDTSLISKENQQITYFFKVTNNGDVTLEDVVVYDPMLGGKIELEKSKLHPNESTFGTATYKTTKDDVGKKVLLNEAKTFGYSPMFTGFRINLDNITPEQLEKELEEIDRNQPGTVPEDIDQDIVPAIGTGIQLLKTTDAEVVSEVGQVITYLFKVKNTGEITLHDVEVNDPMLNEKGIIVTLDKTTLAPNETATATVKYTISKSDLDKDEISNVATATGTPEGFDPKDPNSPEKPEDKDIEKTPIEIAKDNPAIQLEKTSDKDVVSKAGEEITYSFVVTNTGNVELSNVKVNDPTLGGNISLEKTTLAPGESTLGTAKYVVQEADLSKYSIVNKATAEGTPPGYEQNNPDGPKKPTDEDEDIVYTYIVPPAKASINLLKTSNTLSVSEEGDIVKYTFKVTNNGEVPLTNVKITDEMLEKAGVSKIVLGKTKLLPGEFTYGTAEYKVTQADIDNGLIKNIATVEGTPPGFDLDNPNSPEKPTDRDEINVPTNHEPNIAIEKTATENEVVKEGDTITYHFIVTNTGNVTLKDVKVKDEMLEKAGVNVKLNKTELAPEEKAEGSAVYTVTQADIDSGLIENIASAEGTPPGFDLDNPNSPEKPTDRDEINVPTNHEPNIAIEKTATENEVVKEGDTITYHFIVTNTGNVTLKDVKVKDEMLEKAGVNVKLNKTELAPGEKAEGSAIYTVTQADIDSGLIKNIATATGTSPSYDWENPPLDPNESSKQPVSLPDEVDVSVKQNAAIDLVKEANRDELIVGEEIGYTFTVTNSGNVTLSDVTITDKLEGISDIKYISINGETITDTKSISLNPQDVLVAKATYTPTKSDVDFGKVENVATVTAIDPNGKETTDEDHATVPPNEAPSIELEKISDVEKVRKVGQKVTYTFNVTNTGNVTLHDVIINDPMLGGEVELETTKVAPGETISVTKVYRATEADLKNGEIVNVAQVTASTSSGLAVTDEDDDVIQTEMSEEKGVPKHKEGKFLPKTATDIFKMMTIGLGTLLAGITVTYVRRRKQG